MQLERSGYVYEIDINYSYSVGVNNVQWMFRFGR